MNLLHIDSSITGEQSVSRRLTARIVEALKQAEPGATVCYRDLVKDPLPHFSLNGDGTAAAASLEEFLAADVVVVGAPMYNFAIPSQLKAWIDSVSVAGKSFRYTENGPEGLAGGKRVIVASSRGGVYSAGPMAAIDFQESYLRHMFGFLGITDVTFVRAEGVNRGADSRQLAIDGALAHADTLATALEMAA